jgi:hypothetical protein
MIGIVIDINLLEIFFSEEMSTMKTSALIILVLSILLVFSLVL